MVFMRKMDSSQQRLPSSQHEGHRKSCPHHHETITREHCLLFFPSVSFSIPAFRVNSTVCAFMKPQIACQLSCPAPSPSPQRHPSDQNQRESMYGCIPAFICIACGCSPVRIILCRSNSTKWTTVLCPNLSLSDTIVILIRRYFNGHRPSLRPCTGLTLVTGFEKKNSPEITKTTSTETTKKNGQPKEEGPRW